MEGTVHFSISGDALTKIVRNLWADDQEPEKAMRILEAAFPTMTYGEKLMIVCGEKRLDGDERSMELMDDGSTHTENGSSLTLNNMIAQLRRRADEHTPASPLDEGEPEEEPKFPLVIKDEITHDSGWLSPEGKFYPCGYMEHTAVARALGHYDEKPMDRLGWVRLSIGHPPLPGEKSPTQAQIDKLFDRFGDELPRWVLEGV